HSHRAGIGPVFFRAFLCLFVVILRDEKKKRGAAVSHASSLLGTAEGPAGLGGVGGVAVLRGRILVSFDGDPILFAQPAPQVNQPAAFAAEWPMWPFRLVLALHQAVADRAAYPIHRILRSETCSFSPRLSPLSPPLCRWPQRWCRCCRTYCWQRACRRRACCFPFPPWQRSCTTRSGSRSDRSRTP